MQTFRFANEEYEVRKGFVDIRPNPASVIRLWVDVAHKNETEYEFAVASTTASFCIDPELARAIIDTLTSRPRHHASRRVAVRLARDSFEVDYEAPKTYDPRISKDAAERYFRIVMNAVEAARRTSDHVDEATLRTAEVDARADLLSHARDAGTRSVSS